MTPGTKIGVYEIVALIGAGGMGEVYRAKDTKLKREVALKVLPDAFATDPERMARFQREAEVLASLNHTNIAQIYGVEDRALVMELVEGESPKGPMPFDEAWKIASQIAAGLDYAHEKGIVHRDLKPANIKITPEGVVKLLDFGLAKAFTGQAAASGNPENTPTLTLGATQLGVILGTAAYMAPEQAKGKTVDRRADIWSFGVVLYELLTGERLFTGDDVGDTLAQLRTKQPDLEKVPLPARRLLRECLQKDPKDRLRDIGDAKRQLVEVSPPAPPAASVPAPSRPRFGSISTAAATVLTLALGALAFVHLREQPVQTQMFQYTLPAPEKAHDIQYFVLSPDGHYLAMAANGEGGTQIWVHAMDSLESHPLPGTSNAAYPFWSPDSRYIGFFADQKLKKISVSGGPAQTLCDVLGPRGGAWGQHDVILFARSTGGLSRVPAVGGVPVPATKIAAASQRVPTFLPDGRSFLYVAGLSNANGIYLSSLDNNSAPRRVVADVSTPAYFNGHLLFVRNRTLMAQPVDPKTFDSSGDVFPVAEHLERGRNGGDDLYTISTNGVLVYQNGGDAAVGRKLLWFDRVGRELSEAGGAIRTSNFDSFSLSPDGRRIATARGEEAGGGGDLWITDLDHSTDSRLTFGSQNRDPIWSPDGSKIVFGSNRGGTINLYLRASNGTGQDELLYESKEVKRLWDWSRDGRFVIFSDISAGTSDLWALPLTGEKKPIALVRSEFAKGSGQLSPDGRWLAYTSRSESARLEVYVVPFAAGSDKSAAGKWQVSTAGGGQPRWRADGKELFYIALDRKLMAVDVKASATTFDRGTPHPLFESPSDTPPSALYIWGYVPAPDGRRFLIDSAPAGSNATPLTVVVNWLAGVKK
jgi:serine/threonine protein kinase